MDKITVLECMYSIIKDSADWYVENELLKDNDYINYVNGVVAMTDIILEQIKFNGETKEIFIGEKSILM